METIESSFHNKFQHQFSSVSLLTIYHQNVKYQPKPTMPLRSLPIRRIATTQFNHRRPISINSNLTSVTPKSMAEESKKIDIQTEMNSSKSEDVKHKESDKSTSPLPPPPEKPLPGDCCGSGCVRCVWDVYYEELEEYDKLIKANSS